jgi:carbon monoxide dehydrogenase subunit G
MQIEEKIRIQATPDKIFPFYENVSSWSSWDPDVQSSSIDGEFIAGAKGRLKPVKGPEAEIEFTEITKNQSFTTISKLPLCTMSFVHELVPSGEATEVSHKVVFSGLLSPLFGRLIGTGIRKGLPATMQGLRNAVESKANK